MVQQSSCSVVWKVFDVINEIDIIPSHERRLMFNKRCVKLNREGFNETYFIYATLFFHILVLWFLCFISKLNFNLYLQIFFNWQCWYRFQIMKIRNCPAQFSRLTKLISGYQYKPSDKCKVHPIYLVISLTHWGRVTHICVSKIITIGSESGLSPGRRQAIIWTNAGILLIGPLESNFNEI